jgi:tRNA (guanine-N7-)-methyltransferase
MNVSQQRAMNTLASTYLIDVPRDATSTSVAPGSRLDLPAIFGRTAPLTVEIGVGSGDVLAALAAAHPERDFIGFEVYLPSIATTLNKLENAGAGNARVIMADATAGLEHLFGPADLDELCRNLRDLAAEGDILICMGAGDITKWAAALADGICDARTRK